MTARQDQLQLGDLPSAAHDPGGKVRVKLEQSVRGNAFMHGPNDCYRTWLTREWGRRPSQHGSLPDRFILWIGLNPSTADASFNDPTINREIDFSMEFGADALVKCNVMDLRATKPEMLLAPGVTPCSKINLPFIRDTAKRAERIICAWGASRRGLEPFAIAVEQSLRDDGHDLFCLGLTKAGAPRHPLYLRGDTPLIEFKEIPL